MLLSALALAACGGRAASDEVLAARVGVLGDSLATQAAGEIDEALAPVTVRNESAVGRRIEQAAPDARRLVGDDYEVIVVILGTNDARRGATERDLDEIDWLVALLEPARCVLWVSVHDATGDEAFDRGATTINARLHSHADVTVIRWRPLGSWLASDRIHLDDAGQRVLAEAIRDGVESC